MANGAAEAAGYKQNEQAALAAGLQTLDLNQEITFTQYIRLVLPLDGYVFWVRSDLVSSSAMLNVLQLNTTTLNEAQTLIAPAPVITIRGSLHYSTQVNQNESETEAVNTVIFTALEPVQLFNEIQPPVLWIGVYGGQTNEGFDGPINFAFSARGRYYEKADLYHYIGTAVLPTFRTQLIDRLDQLVPQELIVSNSLPIWLSLQQYMPPYPGFYSTIPLFPSFLVPDNLLPPYGAVHIPPNETVAWQAAPFLDPTLGQWSLTSEHVRVTFYGLNNLQISTWLSMVYQYMYDYNTMGLVDTPAIKDEKRTSPELGVLAQKKTIDFQITYNQNAARNVARQYLEKAIVGYDYLPQPLTVVGYVPPAP